MSEHIILIGAYGWQHPHWDEVFYPEDLPLEWKIGYYGNEFLIVVVPNNYWLADSGQYAEWLEESDEALRFIAEWPASGASELELEQARHGIEQLSERITAVLVPITAKPNEREWQHIYSISKQHKMSFDVALELRVAFLAELNSRFPELAYGICWDGEQDRQDDIKSGTVGICRIEQDREPKALRMLLETMIASSGEQRQLVLIIDGAPPDMKLLTNAGIILDLL